MLKLRRLCLAVLALAAAGGAVAQDLRQEDRRADRQAERRDDRAAHPAAAGEVEARIALPRKADGSVDQAALEREIRARFGAGVTELQLRGVNQQDLERLLLDAKSTFLADLGALLPNDGVERQLRLRGAVDARVQRNDEGELRARIEGLNFGTLTSAGRAELARQLAAQAGLDRLRLRGVDANGDRQRVEFRDDRGIVKNEARADRREDRAERREDRRADRREDRREDRRADRREDRPERMARAERPERAERAERPERVERPERGGNSGPH